MGKNKQGRERGPLLFDTEDQEREEYLAKRRRKQVLEVTKDNRITRQRRELRRLNRVFLAQRERLTRLRRDYDSLIKRHIALEDKRNGLMGEVGKYDLAVAHGRQALGPKARAKFDAEFNRIMKGETNEQE